MKNIKFLSFGTFVLLAGLQFWLVGCVADVGGPVYYRHEDHWYHDGPWMDGDRWGGGPRGGVDIDIHPPGWRR